jgi:hypothetical protein
MLAQASGPQLNQLSALVPLSDLTTPAAERQSCGDSRIVQSARTAVGEEFQESDPLQQLEQEENEAETPHSSSMATNHPSGDCSRPVPEPPCAVGTTSTFPTPSVQPIPASFEPPFQAVEAILQPEHTAAMLVLEPGLQDMTNGLDTQQLPLGQDSWITDFFENIQGSDANVSLLIF